MLNNKITVCNRYSEIILQSAMRDEELDTVYQDMLAIRQTLSKLSSSLIMDIDRGRFSTTQKQHITKILQLILNSSICKKLIESLIVTKRMHMFEIIFTSFEKKYHSIKKRAIIKVLSAIPLTSKYIDKVKSFVESKDFFKNKEIYIENIVDKSILDGIIIKSDCYRILDLSVLGKLRKIAKIQC